MIRSVLYLKPKDVDGRAIADFYRLHGVLDRALEQDGCLGSELQLPLDGGDAVLVTALWRDADAYFGWLENPARAAYADGLAQLVADFDQGVRGELYEIVVEAVPER
jgi:heme-degrading monooxygenase HmoA